MSTICFHRLFAFQPRSLLISRKYAGKLHLLTARLIWFLSYIFVNWWKLPLEIATRWILFLDMRPCYCTTKAGRPDTFSSGFISEHGKSSFSWESPLSFLGTNVEADSFICIRGFWLTSNDAVPPSKIFLSDDFMVASRTVSSWRNTCLLSGVSLTSRYYLIMENESLKDDEWNN